MIPQRSIGGNESSGVARLSRGACRLDPRRDHLGDGSLWQNRHVRRWIDPRRVVRRHPPWCGAGTSAPPPDPVALRRIDWNLAPFYCSDCDLNYCRADWHTYVLVDEGFYDCTMGTCPGGHKHMVDD